MEGTIGEIRMFAGNYAPLYWMFCQGQTLQIINYNTLYAIIGTIYGGNGSSTFVLPDLRSRVCVGTGQGPGLINRPLASTAGTENVTIGIAEMPMHSHPVGVQAGTGPISATATLNGINDTGGNPNPGGNYLGKDTGAGSTSYATGGATTAMNAGSITVNSLNAPLPNIMLQPTGGSQPHTNIQPVLGMNYIICIEGIFPSRN